LILSFEIKRFGDASAVGRLAFGGDFERLAANIRRGYLTGIGDRMAGAVATDVESTDCVVFTFEGARYARIKCDRCALDCWASEKKGKKIQLNKLKVFDVFDGVLHTAYLIKIIT